MSNSKTIDTQIDEIVSKVHKFQEEVDILRSKISSKWKTSGFLDVPGCTVKKIQVAEKKDIIATTALIMRMKASFTEAFEFLEIAPVESLQTISGYAIEDFLSDLKKRYQILDLKEKEEQLSQMRSVAESFESTDRKRSKALDEIMKNLDKFSTK